MIDLWLKSGTVGIILIPFVLLYSIAFGIVWLTHMSPARPFFASCIGIAGPFFASVAVLFGLFSAFLANNVQNRNAHLDAAIFSEADGLRTILRIAEALGPTGRPIAVAAIDYMQTVLTKEWPSMLRRDNVPENIGALRNLALAVLAPELTATLAPAAHHVLLEGLVEVRKARRERLTLSAGTSDGMNWIAMIALGVLTQIAVAVVQLERMRPQALALFVFTTAFATTVVLVGLANDPLSRNDVAPLRAAAAPAMP